MNKDVHTHWNEDGNMTHKHPGGYLQHDHYTAAEMNDRMIEVGPLEWIVLFFAAVGVVAFVWFMVVLFAGLFG